MKTTDFSGWKSWIESKEESYDVDLCREVEEYFSAYVIDDSSDEDVVVRFRNRKTDNVVDTLRSLSNNNELYLNYIKAVEGQENVYHIRYGVNVAA